MPRHAHLLQIDRSEVIAQQVVDQIRAKILSGELPQGVKLPSTAAIAHQSDINIRTVHQALCVLVKEGLISRRRKVGTFVTELNKSISPIGIYSAMDLPTASHNAFINRLVLELQQEAQHRDMKAVIWNDPRSDLRAVRPLPELVAAVRKGEIKSLIALHTHGGRKEWIEKLHVPTSISGDSPRVRVHLNHLHFLETALAALKSKGCESVALISNLDPSVVDEPFLRLCRTFGLRTRTEFFIHDSKYGETNLERFGFLGFKNLWRLAPDHPEGIVVYPDRAARGVITAAYGSGAKIGEDLHLAIHKNKEIDLFCPVKATLVACSVREVARSHIKQLERMKNGAATNQILIKYVASETAGCLSEET